MNKPLHQQAKAPTNNQVVLAQHTVISSVLPPAEELQKLKEVNPEIIDWILNNANKEQDHRHQFDNDKVLLTKKDLNLNFCINITCIVFAFILMVCFIASSVWMINNNYPVAGTIFAGTSIVGVIALFMRIPRQHK